MVRTRKPKTAPEQPLEGEPCDAKANLNRIPRSKAEKKRKILETMPEDALNTVKNNLVLKIRFWQKESWSFLSDIQQSYNWYHRNLRLLLTLVLLTFLVISTCLS